MCFVALRDRPATRDGLLQAPRGYYGAYYIRNFYDIKKVKGSIMAKNIRGIFVNDLNDVEIFFSNAYHELQKINHIGATIEDFLKPLKKEL